MPESLLLAMGVVEAHHKNRIWPWAVGDAGRSYWFSSRKEATAHIRRRLGAGARNMDVGCLQMNLLWAGRGLNVDEILDPMTNADAAARHLLRLYRENGRRWTGAVASYHSRRPVRRRRYVCRVFVHLTRIREGRPRRHGMCPPR